MRAAGERARFLLAARLARDADQSLLGDEHAVAQDFLFGQVVRRRAGLSHQRIEEVVVLAR